MNLSPEQLSEINSKVIKKLKDFIKTIETNGVDGIGFDFTTMDPEDLLDKATDALASGDLLGTVVLNVMDNMDSFGDS